MNALLGKVRSKFAIGSMIGVLVFAALLGTLTMAKAQDGTPTPDATGPATVTVNGHGSVTLPPDTASILIGIDVTKPTLAEAQAAAADQMTAIITALKDAGVEEKDIQTVNYSVYVLRNYDNATGSPTEITGFQVTNQVNVIVRDVDQVGDLLDQVVDAGANNIFGINFYVDDTSGPASAARELAVQDATEKAEELAAAAGLSLGRVVSINESYGPPPQPLPYQAEARDMAQGAGGTPVQTGTTEVTVDVSMTFELVP
jgi:uncharacterized protein YggE